ncbi:MAG: hypothetical protein M1839_008419 [Geoglossum umbratile]|nr:MAG: hypothetical protein M1839_008419 [Geoglossum umbratile]
MAKSKSREAQDTAITANPPQRKRCHKGIFVTNSDSSGNESSVSRTKKVKVEGPYEGSSCDAKDKEKNDQLKMDMAKALAGVDDPSKGHERYACTTARS